MPRFRYALPIAVLATLAGMCYGQNPLDAATRPCTATYTHDGYPGPHWNHHNGGTLTGNTIHVTCPTKTTRWRMRYCVQTVTGSDGWTSTRPIFCTTSHGRGGQLYSVSQNHTPCSRTLRYRTHIHNPATGGSQNKPRSGLYLKC